MHFVRLQNVSSQLHFLLRNVEDLLVDRVLRNELVHGDFALLPNPVAAILCLTVHRRIEVAVVDDDRVGADQIQSQSSRPRRQHKDTTLNSMCYVYFAVEEVLKASTCFCRSAAGVYLNEMPMKCVPGRQFEGLGCVGIRRQKR